MAGVLAAGFSEASSPQLPRAGRSAHTGEVASRLCCIVAGLMQFSRGSAFAIGSRPRDAAVNCFRGGSCFATVRDDDGVNVEEGQTALQ